MPARTTEPNPARDAVAVFDREALHYDGAYDRRSLGGHTVRARLDAVLDVLGAGTGEVLDAGMGPGRLCAALASRGFRVTGVDASAKMVELARERMPDSADRLLEAEIEALPFPDHSFDVAVATGVVEYVDYRESALHELARVVKPGGLVLVSIANGWSPYAIWRGHVYYPLVRVAKRFVRTGTAPPLARPKAPSRPAFSRSLASCGLSLESVVYLDHYLLPAPLDELFPKASIRLARRLEQLPRAGALTASHLLFVARRSA
jgi:ubiquinone/menaquinone biosynthesis C-methylase UbiE